jgi:hypothetical protein
MLTQGHNAARDAARAELGKLNQDLDRLVQPCWTARQRTSIKRIAQLEVRVLEGQIARGEDAKLAVHPSMASRGCCHSPEGDRDAIGDLGLDRRSWTTEDPDFVDRLVMLHPRRPEDRAPPARVHDRVAGEGSPRPAQA